MLTTTTTGAKAISPDTITQLIVLPVQRASVAMQVSTIIPTSSTRTHVPRVTADPSVSWVAEGDEIGASDPTVDDIVLEPAKIAGLTVITNELAADTSPAASGIIGDGLTRDFAKKIDLAFFGTKGASLVQPAGLEDLVGFSAVVKPAAWADFDPFAEAIANAEGLGLDLTGFVASPADVLLLSKLKESTSSKRGLLTPDPTNPTRRLIFGVPLITSLAVATGTVWGIPNIRSVIVRRNDVDLQTDKSAYFTSDRTAIRATMRVSWGFTQPAAIQKIKAATV
ncbi:phage major capsid protein [Cryobacterium sp. TMS1-20-1]|uniref:phage major capsid protein n=1 Tax=Cryobacterium sp. TMS1-20-1 TaxID=1259223 RepID=UPI00106D9E47|nr:phage major capsid protein [Cryobacterium sp. TMS1-20-1]TFC71397.1 phage major capsid protein [Cryobacterium sp. TMS1-20-1]